MSRTSISTPCPAPYTLSNLPVPVPGRRLSRTSIGSVQDDTAEIDYTRAIQVEFRNAKPRRKSTFQQREKKDVGITIFEDVLEDQELVVESRPHAGGNTLLGKAARKLPGRKLPKKQGEEISVQQPLQQVGQTRRRISMAPQPTILEDEPETQGVKEGTTENVSPARDMKGGLKKEPRRRTIFVPPDDTTVMTIHPGANKTDRLNDTFQLGDFAVKPPSPRQEIRPAVEQSVSQPAKRPRMSLAAAPKRAPLQQVAAQDSNVPGMDIAGQNSGKENVPPRAKVSHIVGDSKPKVNLMARYEGARVRSSVFEPTAASRARQSVAPRNAVPLSKGSMNPVKRPAAITENRSVSAHIKPKRQSILPRHEPRYQASPKFEAASDESKPIVQKPRPRPVERKFSKLHQYPVLSEDIAQPELYEDSWLGHQEVALTEVINEIFARAEPSKDEWQHPKKNTRERMIDKYHQPSVTRLYKRLQASLTYGALSRPRDAPRPPNPALDIGLRKRFLSLWLDSYNQESLHTAAEVIFGHQLPSHLRGSASDDGNLDPHRGRRTLIGFLETFLVDVEDVEELDEERGDDPNVRWRKTVLRSFMLIWLLDQAKASGVIDGCLFKATSLRKTSVSVIHTLVSMLVLSIGDIMRVLRHLDYEVSRIQDPLDEVHYRIENIAVDLRDGVLLTRLVELLLFTPKVSRTDDRAANEATVTFRMPDFTILESVLHSSPGLPCPRPLSQHLRMPCLGRVQKMYNIEIAVSALRDHGKLGDSALDITAVDIVDGHREKTLSLLWSLVSTHGLEQLVNFEDLAADIKRNAIDATDAEAVPKDCSHLSLPQQESLLKKWASTYCARKGVRISNLTTSFADGKAYAAILTSFEEYMDTKSSPRSSSSQTSSRDLEAQLHAFGCSTAFTKQIVTACGTIPSRKTTVSNLAFLSSRLLPLARRYNAAVVIQRTFRRKQSRIIISRRIALMRLAHACATVVQTRNQLIDAAVFLQRAWRNVLDARIRRLNRDVESFQAVARSWTARRQIHRRRSNAGCSRQSLRLMGGW